MKQAFGCCSRFPGASCVLLLGALAVVACGEASDHPIVSGGGSAGFAGSSGGDDSGGSANGGSANGGSANGGSANGGSGGWPSGGTSSGGAAGSTAGGSGGASGGAAGSSGGSAGTSGGSAGTGAAGSGAMGGSGGSGGAPPVVWKLHRYSLTTNSWQTFPLNQIWTGAGAPPPRDISATTNLDVFTTPMLLVFTTSGEYYLRRGSVWSHATISSKFNRNSATVEAAYSVPWGALSGNTPPVEDVTISSFPNVAIYKVDGNLNIIESSVQTMVDAPTSEGPPQGSVPARYWTVVADADNYISPGVWLDLFQVLENGNLYATDNAFVWTRFAPASSYVIFQASGAPNPNTLTAAYYEVAGNVVNFVGP